MSEADWANTRYFPEYLEVLQAKEPPVPVWSGVSGQISKKVGEVEDKVEALENKLSSKVEALENKLSSKVEALQKGQMELDAKLEAILKAVTAANGAPQPEPER